jgi:hypothetical protein
MNKTDSKKISKRSLSDFPELLMERFPIANDSPITISLKYMLSNFLFSENEGEENVVKKIEDYFEDLVKSEIIKSWKKEDKNGISFEIVYTKEFISDIKANNLARRKELDKVVLDASAILALLKMEQGHEIVAQHLDNAIVSSVNFSEVLTVLARNGFGQEEVIKFLKEIFLHIEEFNTEQAIIAASFAEPKLSFGDRACLALAKTRNLPLLTANEVWKELKISVEVQLTR